MTERIFTEKESAYKKIRTIGVVVEAHVPDWIISRYWGEWDELEKACKKWVAEFHEFINDHRSQDPVVLKVVRKEQECCSNCGCEWEPVRINDEGLDDPDASLTCAGCGAIISDDQEI